MQNRDKLYLFIYECFSIFIRYLVPILFSFFRFLKGYRNISVEVEEGICQVLAHMWLISQISATSSRQGKRSPFEKKLAEFFKHQIESDMSHVYGNGFRAGNQAVLKYGLQKTLYHIKSTGSFPFWMTFSLFIMNEY